MLGDGDLGDAGRLGPGAVGRHLFDGGFGVTLRVRPQMEVVVEHAVEPFGQSTRRMRVTPSRTVVCTTTTRGSTANASLNRRRATVSALWSGGVEDPAAPQGVVGGDQARDRRQLGQDRLEVVG